MDDFKNSILQIQCCYFEKKNVIKIWDSPKKKDFNLNYLIEL